MKIILLGFSLLGAALLAHSATKTWDGSSSGNWGTSANWTGNVIPANGDDLVFPAGVTRFTITNNLTDLRVKSMTFSGSNYVVYGNSITLTNGVTASYTNGSDSINFSIQLGAAQTFNCTNSAASITFNGNITNNGNGLTVIGNGDTLLKGVLSGTGGLTVNANGFISLYGTNTFSGLTAVSDGYLLVRNTSALGATTAGTVLSGGTIYLYESVSGESLTNNSASSKINTVADPVTWSGNVVLNADLSFYITTNLTLSGVISGSAGFTKNGEGTMTLSGSSANIYSGNTTVGEGTLELNKTLGDAISGPLIIGVGVDHLYKPVVRSLTSTVIAAVPITVKVDGLLDLNGFSDTIGSLTMIGGKVTTGTGILTLGGNLTASAATVSPLDAPTIDGILSLGSSTRTFDVALANYAPMLTIPAEIRGSGGIIKIGLGSVQFSGSNTYSGLTTISNGTIWVASTNGLGTTNAGTVLQGNFSALMIEGVTVYDEPLTNNAFCYFQAFNSAGWSGGLVLNSSLIFDSGYGTFDISGPISGNGSVSKLYTPGTLRFSGSSANTYAGTTYVEQGVLELAKSAANVALTNDLVVGSASGTNAATVRLQVTPQLPNTVAVTVNAPGTFEINVTENFGSLAGSGSVVIASGNTCLPGFDNSSTLFSGLISGAGSFTKSGNGTMILSGNNTYSGATTVTSGTLLVNGSQPQSHVTVNASGTLGGTGTVGNVNNISGGIVAPGASPGMLTCSNVNFSGVTSDFTVELNGTTPGTGYDQLNVRGTNNLGGSTLNVSLGAGFTPANGQVFVVLTNDSTDATIGTFAGLPQGSVFSAGGFPFKISYTGGDGNDVTLTAITPGVWTNSAGGSYQTAANWLDSFPPGATDSAKFSSNVSYQVTWANNAAASDAFFNAGSGTVTQSIGAFTWLLTNSYAVGQNAGTAPRVILQNGTLRVTNLIGTGTLDVRRGTNRIDSGVTEADRLLLTNSAGRFEFNGGTLMVRSSTIANGQTFSVGNSIADAVINLIGNGVHSFANGLTLRNKASLVGNGTVNGIVTVLSGSTVAPGASVGKIVLNNSPSLQGAVLIELSKNGATLTNDQIQVSGALNYGGALTVNHLGPDALALGDRFQLFNATSYSGDFSSLILPPLGAGLIWTNKLNFDGSIEVTTGYSLTVTVIGSGNVTRNPDQLSYAPGSVVQLTAISGACTAFDSWSGDASGTNNPHNVTLTANKAVTANFVSPSDVIFCDDFELGDMSRWTTTTNAANTVLPLLNDSFTNAEPVNGLRSAKASNEFARMHRNIVADNGGQELTNGFRFTSWIWDSGSSGVNSGRFYNELRAYSGSGIENGSTNGIGQTLEQLIALGKYRAGTLGFGDTSFSSTTYQGRVAFGSGAGWFNLNDPGAPVRSPGWHKFEIEQSNDSQTLKFFVDGILSRTVTNPLPKSFDTLILGPGVSSNPDTAYFDGIKLERVAVAAPSITSQPQSRTNIVGTTADFSVTASGTGTLSYQWRRNGANLGNSGNVSGATTAHLTITNLSAGQAGEYSVVVSDSFGAVTSSIAIIAIVVPVITPYPNLLPDAVYFSQDQIFASYVGNSVNLVLSNIQLKPFRDMPPQYISTDEHQNFALELTGQGECTGVNCGPSSSPFSLQMSGRAQSVAYNKGPTDTTGTFATEMLAMNLSGTGGMMMRESPTLQSLGQTTINAIGGGLYRISGFFDLFTELSLDGGQTWIPADRPAHVFLGNITRGVPPQITSLISDPPSGFKRINALGETNLAYAVQAASNLNAPIFWIGIGTNVADNNGMLQFTDTNAPLFTNRFYRLTLP